MVQVICISKFLGELDAGCLKRCRHLCEECPAHGAGHFVHVPDYLPRKFPLFSPSVAGLPPLPPRMSWRAQNHHNTVTPGMNCQRQISSGSTFRETLVFLRTSTPARPPSRSVFSSTLVEFARFTRFVLPHDNDPLKYYIVQTTSIGPWSGRRRCQDG